MEPDASISGSSSKRCLQASTGAAPTAGELPSRQLHLRNTGSGLVSGMVVGSGRRNNLLTGVVQYSKQLEDIVPPGDGVQIARLTGSVSAWRDSVLAFASEADLKVASSPITSGVQAFIPAPNMSGGSSAELAVRGAQYKLAMTSAQLNASRENSRLASEKLMQVTGQLGEIMAQVCKVDLQKQNVSFDFYAVATDTHISHIHVLDLQWEEIMAILLKAIDFLCELKQYLNNLVHFFNSVHNLVSISMREAANDFIKMVKDATMIEDRPAYGRTPQIGGITLDAWARQVEPLIPDDGHDDSSRLTSQAIYNHALSVAKISRVVENISDASTHFISNGVDNG